MVRLLIYSVAKNYDFDDRSNFGDNFFDVGGDFFVMTCRQDLTFKSCHQPILSPISGTELNRFYGFNSTMTLESK